MSEPSQALVDVHDVTLLVDTFGDHVDGAPLTYAALRVDAPRLRRLLALVHTFDEGVQAGLIRTPIRRPASATEIDLFPTFIPRKATQRKPHYSVFLEARRDYRSVQLFDPALFSHITPVGHTTPMLSLASHTVSFDVIQQPVARNMFTTGIDLSTLYLALAILTPAADLPQLLQEIARRSPAALLALLDEEGVAYFTAAGRSMLTLPESVRLDARAVADMLAHGDADVRERMMERLSRILDSHTQAWVASPLPSVQGLRRGR